MSRTAPRVGTAGGLPGAGAAHVPVEPAWRPWHQLAELVHTAAADPAWSTTEPKLPPPSADGVAPNGAPLLHGATVTAPARKLRRLVRDLLRAAADAAGEEGAAGASLSKLRARRLDVLVMLRAAIEQDSLTIERIATEVGADADALAVVAQLAAKPLLAACARHLRTRIPPTWLAGHCPVCGAWPALAEMRGLERNRRLRCGRCAADWPLPVLHCPFCDEMRHAQLRTLAPEGEEQVRRIDACDSCKGYLKSFSVLQPMPLAALAEADVRSLELDLIAQERGYTRPTRVAFALSVTVERESRSLADRLARWT